MPRSPVPGTGALSAVGTVKNFVTIMRELSFDQERMQAETQPRVLVLAADPATGSRIGDQLTGTTGSPAITVWPLDATNRNIDLYDVVVIYNPATSETFHKMRDKAGINGMKVFDLANADGDPEKWAEPLRQRITAMQPELAPAFGRWFPSFRSAATKAVIDETARVNAQFAVVANIPSAIPIIGALASAGADFFVLTKNQVMMAFKLAAIHGRDLSDQWGIVRELLPIVGAGFMWRTLAREAASFLPLMAGTIPKVAIAYTGTVAAGRGAEFYYRFGKKPSRDQLAVYYQQASESLKRLPLPGGRDKDSEA